YILTGFAWPQRISPPSVRQQLRLTFLNSRQRDAVKTMGIVKKGKGQTRKHAKQRCGLQQAGSNGIWHNRTQIAKSKEQRVQRPCAGADCPVLADDYFALNDEYWSIALTDRTERLN